METFEIYLNSKTASRKMNNESSDCYFELPVIVSDQLKESAYISVKSACIPYSWYNINDYNNILDIYCDGDNYSLTIPVGNYNINTLISAIESVMLPTGLQISLKYIPNVNHVSFTHSSLPFQILQSSTCYEALGFTENLNYNSVANYIESVNGINLFNVRQILINSNNFVLNNINSYQNGNASILSSVTVTGNPNSILHYKNNTSIHKIHHLNNLSNLHIKLTDEIGRPLLLNNINWSLTLEVTIKRI